MTNNIQNYEILKSNQRGHANHGWLNSYHSFSFADYYNPRQMGFSDLRVINDDDIAPGMGFGMHPHRDMEIFSYVTEGELAHKDSMGNGETIKVGDVQLMSAGTGVRHSEFNPSSKNKSHLFQIWILPSEPGGQPGYQQKYFSEESKRGQLKLIISPNGEKDSLVIKQNAKIYAGLLNGEESTHLETVLSRSYYVHVIKGSIHVGGILLSAGDAIKIFEMDGNLTFDKADNAEILVFDLMKH